MVSPWFASAVAEDRGLLLPGRPRGHTASILLAPDRVSVWAGTTFAHLSWDDHGSSHSRPRSSWQITLFLTGARRGGGIALGVGGEAAEATAPVRAATSTFLTWTFRDAWRGVVVPLRPFGSSWSIEAERHTLQALCTHLARNPAIRPSLADPERVRWLIRDLAHGARRSRAEPSGLRRTTVEVVAALLGLGYVHRLLGRPLPSDKPPPLETIVDQVLDRIRQSPYARHLSISPERAARVIRRRYLDVEPWPFAALDPTP